MQCRLFFWTRRLYIKAQLCDYSNHTSSTSVDPIASTFSTHLRGCWTRFPTFRTLFHVKVICLILFFLFGSNRCRLRLEKSLFSHATWQPPVFWNKWAVWEIKYDPLPRRKSHYSEYIFVLLFLSFLNQILWAEKGELSLSRFNERSMWTSVIGSPISW